MQQHPNAISYANNYQIKHFFKKGEYYRIAIWKDDIDLTKYFASVLNIPLEYDQINVMNNYDLLVTLATYISEVTEQSTKN